MSVKGLKVLKRLCEKCEKQEKAEGKETNVVYPCIRVKGNRGNFIFFNLLYTQSQLPNYNLVYNNSITDSDFGSRCPVIWL